MTRLTIKRITATLTRLLYLVVASVLLVALLTTLERGLSPGLLSRLASSSQADDLHYTDGGPGQPTTRPMDWRLIMSRPSP